MRTHARAKSMAATQHPSPIQDGDTGCSQWLLLAQEASPEAKHAVCKPCILTIAGGHTMSNAPDLF